MLVGGAYSNVYDGCIGGKTGFTNAASHTLVTVVNKGNLELICIVLKESSDNGKASYINQYDDTKTLIDQAYSNFKNHNVLDNEGTDITRDFTSFNKYFNLDTKNNTGYISIDENSSIILPNNAKYSDAEKKVTFFDNPDIKSGDNIIGEILYTYNKRVVGKINIIMKYYPKSNIANIDLPDEMKKYSLLLEDKSTYENNRKKSAFIQNMITIISLIIVISIIVFIKVQKAKRRRRNAYRSRRNRSRITFDDKSFKL
jgi:D-alanyl-D-alanine carboxypeptidase